MRITCTATDRGNVYEFFRDDDSFYRDLRSLVPLLLACDCDVVIGDEHDAPGAPNLTVGPFSDAHENEFRRRAKRYMEPECSPGPPPPQLLAAQRVAVHDTATGSPRSTHS
jgi:hypothetical protein